ncbi:MAG: QcrA and Rieske domain-containing protein [Polyangiales bacterium]
MADGEDADPKRRTFLTIAGACGCAIAGAALLPSLGVAGAPVGERAEQGARFVVGKLEDFPIGKPRKITIVGDEVDAWNRAPQRKLGSVFIERLNERELRAFTAVCPHLGCLVDLTLDEGGAAKAFNCPCHDSNFALDGTKNPAGPSPRGLDPIPIELTPSGEVAIVFKRFRLGIEAREEA